MFPENLKVGMYLKQIQLKPKFYFHWLQLTNAIPNTRKKFVQNINNNNAPLTIKDHYIIQ